MEDDEEDETHREGDAAVNNRFNICTESVPACECMRSAFYHTALNLGVVPN